MKGIAQILFAERTLRSLSEELEKPTKRPLLEKMLHAKYLGYVDLALAEQLLGTINESPASILICHLSMASRRGHICVKIENGMVKPSVEEIWVSDDSQQTDKITPIDCAHLTRLIVSASQEFEEHLIKDVKVLTPVPAAEKESVACPVLKDGNNYYLQRYWGQETSFLKSFKKLNEEGNQLFPIDLQIVQEKVASLLTENKLLQEQAAAILAACQFPLMILTGGPGTGKTYTAGILLHTILEAIPETKRTHFNISLAAPTGKAASNLEASIRNALKSMEGLFSLKVQTLHQLLGINKNKAHQPSLALNADLVLVDESSMIDLSLMEKLFSSLKPGTRLVLLGDRYQLPSVEAGSLFADLTHFFLSHPQHQSQVVELKTCLRAELKSIVDLADQIKIGEEVATLKLLEKNIEGIGLVKLNGSISPFEQQKNLLRYVLPYFPVITKLPDNPLELLKQFANFRILTPLRKGPLGVDVLNALIFQALSSRMSQNGSQIAPIIVLQNDYQHDLFNGEVGLMVKDKDAEYALFASREQGQECRKIPLLLMPRYEYAYCLSVHKSQGSEFEHVLLLLPEGSQIFGRKALYTGVTRAKRRLEIWSKPELLSQMMKQTGLRQSGVVERLSFSQTLDK